MDYPLFEYAPYESSLASKMVDVVKYEKLDILHVHYAIPHATVAYLAKQILLRQGIKIPVVTTLHGTDITLVGINKTFAPIVEFSIDVSDGVTAVSEALAKQTYETFDIKKKIKVIPNFIDFKRFHKKVDLSLRANFAKDDERILIHISNFRKVKRIDDILAIFQIVRKQIPSKLVLVGDGPERTHLNTLVNEMGITTVSYTHLTLPTSDLV